MKYNKIILLKDGRECCLRNGTENDAQEVLDVFNLTHAETDYLLTYPDENSFTVEQESSFLKAKTESSNEIEIIAVVDGKIAGTAGIDALGNKYKTKTQSGIWNRHRQGILGARLRACADRGMHRMCQRSRIYSAGARRCL